MFVAPILMALAAIAIVLLAAKCAVLLGLVVACATFSFPLGLIGMVGLGVSLLFLLKAQHGSW